MTGALTALLLGALSGAIVRCTALLAAARTIVALSGERYALGLSR